jgi:hypothetical protein
MLFVKEACADGPDYGASQLAANKFSCRSKDGAFEEILRLQPIGA